MKQNYSSVLVCLFLLVITTQSCIKNYEPEVRGVWDVVNVEDIENQVKKEWHFDGNNLMIYRQDINSTDGLFLLDSGRYVVKNTVGGLKMKVGEMNSATYNGDWDIMKLRQDQMILSIQFPGGVNYKEFTKKSGI